MAVASKPAPSTATMLALLGRLPNELLALIRDAPPPTDLVFHVSYYLLSERTEALYDSFDQTRWRAMCRAYGIGCLPHEELQEPNWKQVALDCVRHASMCTHPGCGLARLTENEHQMRTMLWEHQNIQEAISSAEDHGDIVSTTLCEHIAFKWLPANEIDGHYTPYLRPLDEGLAQMPPKDCLDDHIIASRTFATFPPVNLMHCVFGFISGLRVSNTTGVTISDVADRFAQRLLGEFGDARNLEAMFDHVDGDLNSLFPAAWNVQDVMRTLIRLSGWFQIVKWVSLEYHAREDHSRYFKPRFIPRPLPDNSFELW